MFRSRHRPVFRPTAYGTRRRRRVPRWLVLLLTGIIIGSGGLLFLQKSYGPKRLTLEQSEALQVELNSANIETQRLSTELKRKERELAKAEEQLSSAQSNLERVQKRLDTVDEDIQVLAAAIPPDPRGTSPGIRGASFSNVDGELAYQVLIMQDDDKIEPFTGNMEFIVSGRYSSGQQANVSLDPIDIELEHFTQAKGSAALPDHFTAQQITIRIRAEGEEKVAATRTIIARR